MMTRPQPAFFTANIMKTITLRALFVISGVLLIAGLDVLVFRIPLFSLVGCPLALVSVSLFLLIKRAGIGRVLRLIIAGPYMVFWLAMLATPVAAHWHDQWIMHAVRSWGIELRAQQKANGVFPVQAVRVFHGYRMRFISEAYVPPGNMIYFERFDFIRQAYSVTQDVFLPERDAS